MAWVSKFSGLPTLTILPVSGDTYAAGVFTIGAGFPSFTRDWLVGLAFPPSADESPIAYETLAGMGASISQVLRVTARYASRSPTAGFSIGAGVALFGPGTDDCVGVSSEEAAPVANPGDGTVYAAAIENDVHSPGFTPIFAVPPPHRFRLYWNGTGSAFVIPDAGFGSWSVAANTVSYWYSTDDGTTWVRQRDRAIAGGVAPTRVGIFFGSQPSQNNGDTVTFSNLEVMEEGVAGPTDWERSFGTDENPERVAGAEDEINPVEAGGTAKWVAPNIGMGHQLFTNDAGGEDVVNLVDGGGVDKYSFPFLEAGVLLTSKKGRAADENVPHAFMEDAFNLIEGGWRAAYPKWTFPQDDSSMGPQARAGAEDQVIAQLVPISTYHADKQDQDAVDLLGGDQIQNVTIHDTQGESWRSHGSGFHGAGKDGIWYQDGVACGPGNPVNMFGTLAGGIRETAWGYPTLVHRRYGHPSNPAVSIIADDTIRIVATAISGWPSSGVSSRQRWTLTGDFDIEVQYSNYSASSGSDGGLVLEAVIDYDNYFYVRRQKNGLYDRDVRNNAAWGNYVSVGTADTSGRLRLVRVGATVHSYYWNAGWIEIGSGIVMTAGANRPMWVNIKINGDGSLNCSADVFSFVINSGATDNKAAWSTEAAGTHRGLDDAFPDRVAIVSSREAVDIIDADNDKLWMRFQRGTSRALWATTNLWTYAAKMKDGVLVFAHGTRPVDAHEGGGVVVDFTRDSIQICYDLASGVTGGLLRATNGGTNSPVGSTAENLAHGHITSRNAGLGHGADFNNWRVPDKRIYGIDLTFQGGFMYWATAGEGGITAYKYRRFYIENYGILADNEDPNTPDYGYGELNEMRWLEFDDGSGDLFYVDDTTLYLVELTTLDAQLDQVGTGWTADNSVALAGTRSRILQQTTGVARTVGDSIYIGADEGVYFSTAFAAFALHYGKTGSGATHEILPFYDYVAGVSVVQDGATQLLAIALISEQGDYVDPETFVPSQVVLVNPATNTVYAIKRFTYSLAVGGGMAS
jgi:hypothetical protein